MDEDLHQLLRNNREYLTRRHKLVEFSLNTNNNWKRHHNQIKTNLIIGIELLEKAEHKYIENPNQWTYNTYDLHHRNVKVCFAHYHRHQDIQLRYNSI